MRLPTPIYALLCLLCGCTAVQRRALIPETVSVPVTMTQGVAGRYEGTAISFGITPTFRIRPAPVAKVADTTTSPPSPTP